MTKAFDMALFVPANPNSGEVVEIASPGPPLKTQFNTYIGGPPGVTVEASLPAATAQGQSLLSGPGPDFEWDAVATSSTLPVPTGANQTYVSAQSAPYNMQLAAATPQPTAPNQIVVSGGSPGGPWPNTLQTVAQVMAMGNAVTTTGGGAFNASATLSFAPSVSTLTRIDGGDPTKSVLDNFAIDMGTF